MGFLDIYKPVFDRIREKLEATSTFKSIYVAEAFKLTDLPIAIVSPRETLFQRETIQDLVRITIGFDITVVIRETEPENWFTEIITPMCNVYDTLLSDATLEGVVNDLQILLFAPGEITAQNRLYYGGLLRFEAFLWKAP